MAQQKPFWLASIRTQVQSPALLSGLRTGVAMSFGVGCRHGLDLVMLLLWHRVVATPPITLLAWETPYAVWDPKNTTHTKQSLLNLKCLIIPKWRFQGFVHSFSLLSFFFNIEETGIFQIPDGDEFFPDFFFFKKQKRCSPWTGRNLVLNTVEMKMCQ